VSYVQRFLHTPLLVWLLVSGFLLVFIGVTYNFGTSSSEKLELTPAAENKMPAYVETLRFQAMGLPWLVAYPRPLGEYGSSLVEHTEKGLNLAKEQSNPSLEMAWSEAHEAAKAFASIDPNKSPDEFRAGAQSLSSAVDRVIAAFIGVELLPGPPPIYEPMPALNPPSEMLQKG